MAKRIAVIGAGLVGSAAALGLMRQGFEVVLIDGVKPERAAGRLGLDIRNVALNPQSQSLLASLGVWSEVPKVAYERMSIWEHTGTSVLNFSAADAQRTELGWIVENSPLQVALYDRCAAAMEVVLAANEMTIYPAHFDGRFICCKDHFVKRFLGCTELTIYRKGTCDISSVVLILTAGIDEYQVVLFQCGVVLHIVQYAGLHLHCRQR